jgi:broad specificity phosphatase PhoE
MAELEIRVKDFLSDLKKMEGRILIVTHTVIIKMVLKILDSKPISALWGGPFLHPGTILIVDTDHQPCIREVIHPQEKMERSVSYTA